MSKVTTTKMSSKGQIVIPEEIRKKLDLEPGAQFVVVGDGDVIVLRRLSAPDMKDFDALLAEARSQARKSGLKRSDIAAAIAAARGRG